MLDSPHRLEAEIGRFLGQCHVFSIDLVIRHDLIRVLKDRSMSEVHVYYSSNDWFALGGAEP